MIKIALPCFFILSLVSCIPSPELPDYFGQPYPDAVPVIFAPDIISIKGRLEHGISFTSDTQELAFGILNNHESGTIYYSKKDTTHWTKPVIFEPLKTKSAFLPYFTPDGTAMLYAQSIADTNRLYITDIWSIEKTTTRWESPRKIEAPISSIAREANASMTYDGTLYFSSNRNCIGKENCYAADLFSSKLTDTGYQRATEIPEFISPHDKESVFISPKEDYIMFCTYTDNQTWMDLYISYRDTNNSWTQPERLDEAINSKDWDRRPFVSIDNAFLFFTRLQMGAQGAAESDIYWVSTSSVFKPFVYNPPSDIKLSVGEKFEVSIPEDYFKDIDSEQVTLHCNQTDFDWLIFDSKKMTLSGLPVRIGDYDLIFTAVDAFSNTTTDTVKITVTN